MVEPPVSLNPLNPSKQLPNPDLPTPTALTTDSDIGALEPVLFALVDMVNTTNFVSGFRVGADEILLPAKAAF